LLAKIAPLPPILSSRSALIAAKGNSPGVERDSGGLSFIGIVAPGPARVKLGRDGGKRL